MSQANGNGRVTYITASKIVMERHVAEGIAYRQRVLERMLLNARDTIEEQRQLLASALIELAQANRANDAHAWSLRWLHDHGGYTLRRGGTEM